MLMSFLSKVWRILVIEFDFVKVKSSDDKLLKSIHQSEVEAFGEGGEDLWTLRPMAEQQLILAAVTLDEVLAHAILWRNWNNTGTAYLHSFVVHRTRQGKGLGRLFFKRLKDYLLKSKIERLQLTIHESNLAASKIYLSESRLLEKSFIPNAYGEGEDRWFWTLCIKNL